MAAESLTDSKFAASERLVKELLQRRAPLLAAYWEYREEVGRWTLMLVPDSPDQELTLIREATDQLVEPPYRSIFSLSDPSVESRQIPRARALGAYIRVEPYVGRRIDTTFTAGEYFESVVPIYFKAELMTRLQVA
jgi:hypothetical protein|uniref:Uncharacterized protein n=1 Tax=Rhodopseudomonas palustris (strain BisA53) TaxID=316055 RepID=Q07PL4_RHOP5